MSTTLTRLGKFNLEFSTVPYEWLGGGFPTGIVYLTHCGDYTLKPFFFSLTDLEDLTKKESIDWVRLKRDITTTVVSRMWREDTDFTFNHEATVTFSDDETYIFKSGYFTLMDHYFLRNEYEGSCLMVPALSTDVLLIKLERGLGIRVKTLGMEPTTSKYRNPAYIHTQCETEFVILGCRYHAELITLEYFDPVEEDFPTRWPEIAKVVLQGASDVTVKRLIEEILVPQSGPYDRARKSPIRFP